MTSTLVPTCGAWWGVTPNPLDGESWDDALTDYEKTIGRAADIVHYYHRAKELFPTKSEIARAREPGKPRLLFFAWKPENGHTWAEVADGEVDRRIDKLAAHIKKVYDEPFLLTIHHEPEDEVKPYSGSGFTAADYRAMFRHVVERLRAQGADQIVPVMNYVGLPHWGTKPWFGDLYPGDDVVDWIAFDPYIFGRPGGPYRGDVRDLFNRKFPEFGEWPGFYTWTDQVASDKPIMLAEWGVEEHPDDPRAKAAFFTQLGKELPKWPRVKALVYWNHSEGRTVGATRVDSSKASLDAFRKLGELPYLNTQAR